jgi:hypothetical protein
VIKIDNIINQCANCSNRAARLKIRMDDTEVDLCYSCIKILSRMLINDQRINSFPEPQEGCAESRPSAFAEYCTGDTLRAQ